MKRIVLLLVITQAIIAFGQTDSVIISGKVTDFEGHPIPGSLVMIKGANFGRFVDTTYSNKAGQYSLKVKEGNYSALAAVRMQDYGKTKLEFWANEIPAYQNLNINMRYDRLEVYGLNVFQVKGAYPGYTMYFRPMSLSRIDAKDKDSQIIDIAPPADKIDIAVNINGEQVDVNLIQKVEEYAGDQKMYAYLIHTDMGKSTEAKYDKIQVIVEDKENGDKGEAIYFKEKIKYE